MDVIVFGLRVLLFFTDHPVERLELPPAETAAQCERQAKAIVEQNGLGDKGLFNPNYIARADGAIPRAITWRCDAHRPGETIPLFPRRRAPVRKLARVE